MNGPVGLLDPRLRGVVFHVICGRCPALRNTLSQTCSYLRTLLRCERFLRVAAVLHGRTLLCKEDDWQLREQCIRAIYAGIEMPRAFRGGYEYKFWLECIGNGHEGQTTIRIPFYQGITKPYLRYASMPRLCTCNADYDECWRGEDQAISHDPYWTLALDNRSRWIWLVFCPRK